VAGWLAGLVGAKETRTANSHKIAALPKILEPSAPPLQQLLLQLLPACPRARLLLFIPFFLSPVLFVLLVRQEYSISALTADSTPRSSEPDSTRIITAANASLLGGDPYVNPTAAPTSRNQTARVTSAPGSPQNDGATTRRVHIHSKPTLGALASSLLAPNYSTPLCEHYDARPCQHYMRLYRQLREFQLRERTVQRLNCTKPVVVHVSSAWWDGILVRLLNQTSCKVPCTVRLARSASSKDADVRINGGALPVGGEWIRALMAIEQFTPVQDLFAPETLRATDVLISHARASDVHVNYMTDWRTLCGDPRVARDPYACVRPWNNTERTNFAVAFISNCGSTSGKAEKPGTLRKLFFRSMLELAPDRIHNMGRCLPSPFAVNVTRDVRLQLAYNSEAEKFAKKVAFMSKYKFVLALENAVEEDYVTEKIMHAVIAGAVPVYYGAPQAHDFVPGGRRSFISAMDFVSPRALLDYLLLLDANATLYAEYHEWRQHKPSQAFLDLQAYAMNEPGPDNVLCRVCRFVHETWCGAVNA
jgi:hypothetical protein